LFFCFSELEVAMAKSVSRRKTIKPDREKLCRAVLKAAEAVGKQFVDQGGLLAFYLHAQAIATPSSFLALLGKVLANEQDTAVTRIELPSRLIPVFRGPARYRGAWGWTLFRQETELRQNGGCQGVSAVLRRGNRADCRTAGTYEFT